LIVPADFGDAACGSSARSFSPGAAVLAYHWAFGKAKVLYATATVERGDVESTVVAAGIVQPIKYVDVGAQTSGTLKSLKVNRGDLVAEKQLLAEIDPVLADTALTSANATLENMTAQRALKQAQLVLAKAQRDRNDTLFARQLISASDRDVTRANYDVALADAASLSAQMKQATAAVDTAKANVGYTSITAPMAGEIVLHQPSRRANAQREPAGADHPSHWGHQHRDGLGTGLGSGYRPRQSPARMSISPFSAIPGGGTARSGKSFPPRN